MFSHIQPCAIVLGGTYPHGALLRNLKKRGYRTILLDYYGAPPAAKYADLHIRESCLDRISVLSIARIHEASVVISSCVDQANVVACYVSEELGLPRPYAYSLAATVGNKITMKQLLLEHNIPTSPYMVVDHAMSAHALRLKLPVVVKPADTNGSKGVRLASTEIEFEEYVKVAIDSSRIGSAIVESYVEGVEVGLDCFVTGKGAKIVMMHQKRKPAEYGPAVLHSLASLSPPLISTAAENRLQSIADKIAKACGVVNTPLLIQAIVKEDTVSVVEFALRVGGGLNYRRMQLYCGFDMVEAAIDSHLGAPVRVRSSAPTFYHSEVHLHASPGCFGCLAGHEELLQDSTIEEIYINKTRGMEISPDMASKDRIASCILRDTGLAGLLAKTGRMVDTIKIYDIDGFELTQAEIYRKLLAKETSDWAEHFEVSGSKG